MWLTEQPKVGGPRKWLFCSHLQQSKEEFLSLAQ